MAKKDPRFNEYIKEAEPFARPVLKHLRKLVHQNCPQAEEQLKWGMPFFMYGGKILCGMAAFKAHCTLHFWKGARFIKNPTPGAMGQFGRITCLKDLPSDKTLATYIKKATELNKPKAKTSKRALKPKKSPPKASKKPRTKKK
jgi:hypothetical protein